MAKEAKEYRRVNLNLPPIAWEQLASIAAQESRTMPSQIRHAVLSWLGTQQKDDPEAAARAAFFSDTLGSEGEDGGQGEGGGDPFWDGDNADA